MNIIFLDVDGVLNTINSNELMWFHNKEHLQNVEKFKIIKTDFRLLVCTIFQTFILSKMQWI